MDEVRVSQYFERIGLTMPENIVPDAALLEKLVFHNIISIPYENTQFLTKKYIPCNTDDLFQRIVLEKKGGICHDVAGLFGWFLTELGYDVLPVGTVSFQEKLRSHIHKTLIVTDCEGTRWLAETAFSTFMSNKKPIRFVPGMKQLLDGEEFLLEERDGKMCLIGPSVNASFRMEYPGITPEIGTKIKEFTVAGRDPAGKVKRMFSIGTPEGRRTLFGNSYREYFGDRIYSYDCPPEQLPWAYAQFGLQYEDPCDVPD